MKRFVATFNDGSFLNIPADRMEVRENAFILVWLNAQLAAVIDIAGIVGAYMSEKSLPEGKQ